MNVDPKQTISMSRVFRLVGISFVTALSGALMPGPFLVATISQVAARGFTAVFWLLSGHALLELALLALLGLGLRDILKRARVRGAIGLVGGAALVWMGADMILHASELSLTLEADQKAIGSGLGLIVWGAAVSVANPYFTGWWATIGTGQLATMAPKSPSEFLAFFFGHQMGDVIWYCFVAMLIATGAKWLTIGVYRGLIVGCALILVALGIWFFIMGIRFWKKKQTQVA